MADNFDKFLPDWQIGTLTLAANSTGFTATNALLTFGSIQQGDFIISPDGRMLIIESITDDNNGVLSSPCPPEAAGTFQTRIRYQSDNSRYTGQTAALRRLMSGGNLFALAKLAGDAEKIVRFLGNGAFDLVDPSEFGIQDPNGSLAKLAALTLAARQILQTDENGALKAIDLTANKALVTNASKDVELVDLGTLGRALLALSNGTSSQYVRADGILQTLNASAVGLGNVNNTSDANKPVSTAQQTALNTKATLNSSPTFTGIVTRTAPSTEPGAWAFVASGNNQSVPAGEYSVAGKFVSRFTGVNAWSEFFFQDRVQNYSEAAIHLNGYGTSFYWFFRAGGTFHSPGSINAPSKNFEIDHTVDPDNYDLRHCATEAPEMLVEYRGIAKLTNGRVTVNVEDHYGVMTNTFKNLWADAHVHALQNQDGFARVRPSPVNGATFDIICEDETCSDNVAWLVMARRNDPYVRWNGCLSTGDDGRLIIEFEKPE
ncbi:hypothetical protein [Ochrobactrum sp. EDr1-4]|uniref:hypothetical protein n=1 Tax=Ochrobactrum sp. EDr1-4 TaxID=3368622 RepID=UPI003B9F26BC